MEVVIEVGVNRLERRTTLKMVQDILTLFEKNGTQAGVTQCVCFGSRSDAPCQECQRTHTHKHKYTENLFCMDTWPLVPISTTAPMSVFMQTVPISQQKPTHAQLTVLSRESRKRNQ